jgi:hypothetical protein
VTGRGDAGLACRLELVRRLADRIQRLLRQFERSQSKNTMNDGAAAAGGGGGGGAA